MKRYISLAAILAADPVRRVRPVAARARFGRQHAFHLRVRLRRPEQQRRQRRRASRASPASPSRSAGPSDTAGVRKQPRRMRTVHICSARISVLSTTPSPKRSRRGSRTASTRVGLTGCGLAPLATTSFSDICIEGDTVIGLQLRRAAASYDARRAATQLRLKTHTPTATPTSTVTPTPRPATSTPVPASPTKPAGGAAGAVRPPDTGTGGSSSSATSTRELAMLAVALMAIGGVAAGQGIRSRTRRRA